METSTIRMKDGRGMLWPDSFTEERLDMLPDSVPALLVLWNRYHNVRSQSTSGGFKTDS
jgi:linoleate 10R-lipoxygenase